jgi:hypothetical protein
MANTLWKENWEDTKRRFRDWWAGRGFIVGSWPCVALSRPRADVPDPGPARSVEAQWTDVEWRAASTHHRAARTGFPLETLPVMEAWLGPGSTALYLGSEPGWEANTVWFHSVIDDPDRYPAIRLDPENRWWRLQLDLIDAMIERSGGRYLVGGPDFVENWDVLGSLRDTQRLLMDMIERPAWVTERIDQINGAWFRAYDEVYARVRAQDGESMFGWFRLWAPGKVAKVQCDGCAMFSPEMFRQFVAPALSAQCEWLDFSMYHLDGSQCLDKLDALLEIEALTAVEWTPDPRVPSGGDPHWYDLYRRILGAGKRVQVLAARAEQIEPLLDAVGTDGIYFLSYFSTQAQAEEFARVVERSRE